MKTASTQAAHKTEHRPAVPPLVANIQATPIELFLKTFTVQISLTAAGGYIITRRAEEPGSPIYGALLFATTALLVWDIVRGAIRSEHNPFSQLIRAFFDHRRLSWSVYVMFGTALLYAGISLLSGSPQRLPSLPQHDYSVFLFELMDGFSSVITLIFGTSSAWIPSFHVGVSPVVQNQHHPTEDIIHYWVALLHYFGLLCLVNCANMFSLGLSSYYEGSIRRRQPLQTLVQPPQVVVEPRNCIVHLTDLHLTGPRGTMEHGRVDHEDPIPLLCQRILDHFERSGCIRLTVIVTGDITDSGLPDEWVKFERIVEALRAGAAVDVLCVPGNHDVNIPHPFGIDERLDSLQVKSHTLRTVLRAAFVSDTHGGHARAYRCAVAIRCMVATQGKSTKCLVSGRWVPLEKWYAGASSAIDSYIEWVSERTILDRRLEWFRPLQLTTRGDLMALRVLSLWSELFPIVKFPQFDGDFAFIGLNSCSEAGTFLSNAYGWIDRGQLKRLARALARLDDVNVVVGLHHHLGYGDARPSLSNWFKERGMILGNAAEVVRVLDEERDRQVLVLHGHRHTRSWYSTKSMRVVCLGSSSTLLGDEIDRTVAPGDFIWAGWDNSGEVTWGCGKLMDASSSGGDEGNSTSPRAG